MSSVQQQCPTQNITMVAVDKDKNSVYAFRWALNHLDNPLIIAAHVKHKNLPNRRYPLILHFQIHIHLFMVIIITLFKRYLPHCLIIIDSM